MQHDDNENWVFIDIIPAEEDYVFFFSSSPLANTDIMLPHHDVHAITLPEQATVSFLFIRTHGQHHIEYGFGSSSEAPPQDTIKRIDLREYQT